MTEAGTVDGSRSGEDGVATSAGDATWHIDYHVHTACSSDSTASVASVVDAAVAAGLYAICVTDHDTIAGGQEAARIAAGRIAVIIGSEVSLDDGSQILGIGLHADVVSRELEAAAVEIHAQGGLVLMPHPFRRGSGLLRPEVRRTPAQVDRILGLVDLVEAHNGRDTWENNERSRRLVLERGLAGVAGSDAHRADEVGRTFVAYASAPGAHGRDARVLWHPTQRERRESPVRRRIMEFYHAHERQLPGALRSAHRALRRRTHAGGPRRTSTPPTEQLQLGEPGHPVPVPVVTVAQTLRLQLALKRTLDVVAAATGLLLVAPLLAGVGLLVRRDSAGPVLFRQERAGRDGRIFRVLKIRTMTVEVPAIPGASRADLDAARITRVGRVLRRTGIDELPQLVNVLRGEMSLIGPRPDLPHHVERYDPVQCGRLAMRPGLTGWAQVHGRNEITWNDRIGLDLAYVRDWSLRLDVRIIALTLRVLVSGRGAGLAGVSQNDS